MDFIKSGESSNSKKETKDGRGVSGDQGRSARDDTFSASPWLRRLWMQKKTDPLSKAESETYQEGIKIIKGKLQELDNLEYDFNRNLEQHRGKDKDDIEKTNTVKRFRRWWNQEGLKLRKDVQTFLKEGKVTSEDLLDWKNKLEEFNQKTFPKEFNEVENLYEMIESCSEKHQEDQRTLELAPNIKELRKLVIAFVEFNDEEALKRVGRLLPDRSMLPRNEPLPFIPNKDKIVLKVAQGMNVIHRSRTEQSEYTPESFEKYDAFTTIEYNKDNKSIRIHKISNSGNAAYNLQINLEKEEMAFFNSSREYGPHISDLVIRNLRLLSSILERRRHRGDCMSKEHLREAMRDNIAQKIGTFKPKKIRHLGVVNDETLGTIKVANALYGTRTFIFDPDHKTYPACIAMLATSIGYSPIFLINQQEQFSDLRITKIEHKKERMPTDDPYDDDDDNVTDIVEITLEPQRDSDRKWWEKVVSVFG